MQIAEAKKHGVPVAFENELGMRFVLIPAGTFTMGSPEDEEGRPREPEGSRRRTLPYLLPSGPVEPRREFQIKAPYYMQATEVTYSQFRQFMPDWWKRLVRPPDDPSELQVGDPLPLMAVRYDEAVAFAEWLSKSDARHTYRLPVEAEWEHACRAGTQTRFFWGDDLEQTHRYAHVRHASLPPLPEAEVAARHRARLPAGSLEPNPWGLHDMLGNLNEWCAVEEPGPPVKGSDEPVPPRRFGDAVIRGGSCWTTRNWIHFRCAYRETRSLLAHAPDTGFRLLSPLPGSADEAPEEIPSDLGDEDPDDARSPGGAERDDGPLPELSESSYGAPFVEVAAAYVSLAARLGALEGRLEQILAHDREHPAEPSLSYEDAQECRRRLAMARHTCDQLEGWKRLAVEAPASDTQLAVMRASLKLARDYADRAERMLGDLPEGSGAPGDAGQVR